MVVPQESNEGNGREERWYTVQELNDLQSKLMLIAGKAEMGKEDVERFVEVRDFF